MQLQLSLLFFASIRFASAGGGTTSIPSSKQKNSTTSSHHGGLIGTLISNIFDSDSNDDVRATSTLRKASSATRTSSSTSSTPSPSSTPKIGKATLPASTIINIAASSTLTESLSIPTNLPFSIIQEGCASSVTERLSNLSSACSVLAVNIFLDVLRGNVTIFNALSLVNLVTVCGGECQSSLNDFAQVLKSDECSAQLMDPVHQLLAPQVGSLIQVVFATVCTREPQHDDLCLTANSSNELTQLQTIAAKSPDLNSTLLNLSKRTDITCSSCGIAQMTSIVRLDPLRTLSHGVKEDIVGALATIQQSCETEGAPLRSIPSAATSSTISSLLFSLGFILYVYSFNQN